MEHHDVSELLKMLVIMLGAAKMFGGLARVIGQPAVLGELVAGVVVGASVLGWVESGVEAIEIFSELGVIFLLFAIGLETDLKMFVKVGATSGVVAAAGVAMPFVLGYCACRLLGKSDIVSITAGAALTATSVGITARVLSELGKLRSPEGQVILGAAVIDDILGLVILAVVTGLDSDASPTWTGVATIAGSAFGFLALMLGVGLLAVPRLFRLTARLESPGGHVILALILALGLSWLAARAGSAMIVGAFAAGLLVATVPQSHKIEEGITSLGHFFVPLFFVGVGASVELASLDPRTVGGRDALLTGGVLVAVGVAGKWLAGFMPFWFRGDKKLVGAGMVPRGEVGLIFAAEGLDHGVFDDGMFGAVTLMVMVTTMIAPVLLKFLSVRNGGGRDQRDIEAGGIEDLVNDA